MPWNMRVEWFVRRDSDQTVSVHWSHHWPANRNVKPLNSQFRLYELVNLYYQSRLLWAIFYKSLNSYFSLPWIVVTLCWELCIFLLDLNFHDSSVIVLSFSRVSFLDTTTWDNINIEILNTCKYSTYFVIKQFGVWC